MTWNEILDVPKTKTKKKWFYTLSRRISGHKNQVVRNELLNSITL